MQYDFSSMQVQWTSGQPPQLLSCKYWLRVSSFQNFVTLLCQTVGFLATTVRTECCTMLSNCFALDMIHFLHPSGKDSPTKYQGSMEDKSKCFCHVGKASWLGSIMFHMGGQDPYGLPISQYCSVCPSMHPCIHPLTHLPIHSHPPNSPSIHAYICLSFDHPSIQVLVHSPSIFSSLARIMTDTLGPRKFCSQIDQSLQRQSVVICALWNKSQVYS